MTVLTNFHYQVGTVGYFAISPTENMMSLCIAHITATTLAPPRFLPGLVSLLRFLLGFWICNHDFTPNVFRSEAVRLSELERVSQPGM